MTPNSSPLELDSPRQRRLDKIAIAFALVLPSLITVMYFVVLAGQDGRVQQGAYGAGKIVQFAFPLAWTWFALRQATPLRRPSLAGLEWGVSFGLLIAGAMLALYFAWLKPSGFFTATADAVQAKIMGVGVTNVPRYLAMAVFYTIFHSLLEEYYWRWFVFRRLTRHLPLTKAIVISSIGFMAHHVIVLAVYFGVGSPATYIFSLAVAVGGAVWAWIYHRSGSLYGPWLSHLLVDAAIFLIGFDLTRELLAG